MGRTDDRSRKEQHVVAPDPASLPPKICTRAEGRWRLPLHERKGYLLRILPLHTPPALLHPRPLGSYTKLSPDRLVCVKNVHAICPVRTLVR